MNKSIIRVCALISFLGLNPQFVYLQVPPGQRGTSTCERRTILDGNDIRTELFNFGMIGNYPPDPLDVDLTTFHSLEIPNGSGMNYCAGLTPFVLAKLKLPDETIVYIMETGYRERQASRSNGEQMRLEPRPGYFQDTVNINPSLSFALSNNPSTWPSQWADKLADVSDPGWPGSWNGYFGKNEFVADLESYAVLDDNYYDDPLWGAFYPDGVDHTRRGLGLCLGVRTFQWAAPPLSRTMFLHYDVKNEGTVSYDSLYFGFYVDASVGGFGTSCDGANEENDDIAFFDFADNANLVYMWDSLGHGVDLAGTCSETGRVGFTFLQVPGVSKSAANLGIEGLRGFKNSRIVPGPGNPPNSPVDDLVFFTDQNDWPHRLYQQFSSDDLSVRFDTALNRLYNIAPVFATGPFRLNSGDTARIRLAICYGTDQTELRDNAKVARTFFDSHYAVIPSAVQPERVLELPGQFALFGAFPNPFNPSTTIRYGLPQRSHVLLAVFNTLGQQVAILVQGEKEAGYHEVQFDGTGLSSGVYFYRMQAGDYVATKKLLLLK